MSKTESKKESKLEYEEKFVAEVKDAKFAEEANDFCEGYKAFLNAAKTEREGVKEVLSLAKLEGFSEYSGQKLKAGDRVYIINRNKTIILITAGSEDIEQGVNMIIAHLDAPRLDLKAKPLYEENGIGYFKTHYYGGIKKYQWTTIPLSLHGVVLKTDGSKVEINIGEQDDEPSFCISDLLPHLSKNQDKKNLSEGIAGEQLNVIVGSIMLKGEKESDKPSVKKNILQILNSKYGITERDLVTAELEIVPAFRAKDIGFDRSIVGGYGQDDRVCVYPSLKAILNVKNPKKTSVVLLADKEEIGCYGITAPTPLYIRDLITEISEDKNIRKILNNSSCLSCDVNGAYDSNFADVFESKNSTYLGKGVAICKYGGGRGKSGSSDASAEFFGKIANMLDKENILWQTGELGKIDEGGGGTFAADVASAGVEVIDVGVAILSMHSPFELASKLDIYSLYLACKTFLQS